MPCLLCIFGFILEALTLFLSCSPHKGRRGEGHFQAQNGWVQVLMGLIIYLLDKKFCLLFLKSKSKWSFFFLKFVFPIVQEKNNNKLQLLCQNTRAA